MYSMNMNQNHRVRNTSQHLNYLSGFRMALTDAEKQIRWRERKKERNPEQFKEREQKRVKYILITELSADKQTQERQKGKE